MRADVEGNRRQTLILTMSVKPTLSFPFFIILTLFTLPKLHNFASFFLIQLRLFSKPNAPRPSRHIVAGSGMLLTSTSS